MNRFAAFGIVCAAAILFLLVAYARLTDYTASGALQTSVPQLPVFSANRAKGPTISEPALKYSRDDPAHVGIETELVKLPPIKSKTEAVAYASSSDISSSVDENSVVVTDKNVLGTVQNNTDMDKITSVIKAHNENDGKPILVVVLARMRTGSSLVGEIFNQNPSLFYIFEPLHAIDYLLRKHRAPEARRRELSTLLLRLTSKCQFRPDFVESLSRWGLGKFKSSGLRPICKATMGCTKATHTQLEDRCGSFGGRMGMKTIRADLSLLQSLVELDHVNLKIIHLVRDPRGTANSRKTYYSSKRQYRASQNKDSRISTPLSLKSLGLLEENTHLHINTIVKYCKWITDSITLARTRPDWLKDRYMFIRFEDLAVDPTRMSRDIYDFVGMTMPDYVKQWVANNTDESNSVGIKDKFGMQKNSKEVMQSWRHSLSYQEVYDVQTICGKAMDLAGYRKIIRSEQLQDANFDTIDT